MKCLILKQWIESVRVKLPRQFLKTIDDVILSASFISPSPARAREIHNYTTRRIIPVMLDACRLTSVVKRFGWDECSAISTDIHHSAWDATMDYYCEDHSALSEAAKALSHLGIASAIMSTHPEQAAHCLAQAYNHSVDAAWVATEEAERARLQDVFVGMIREMIDGLLSDQIEEAT